MTFWRSLSPGKQKTGPRLPGGRRIYAIGDIHGSAALFDRLIDRILADSIGRDGRRGTVVVLGDFIDRGTDSAAIIQSLFAQRASDNLVVLLGNHEAAMIAAYRGDRAALGFWLTFGGDATLASFGANVAGTDPADVEAMMGLLRRCVPFELVNWMETLPTSYRAGDYLFAHAGIRPGVSLSRQKTADLLWIRDEFLASDDDHGVVVVHGHSPIDQVEFRTNRIGVDTGAYKSGILSAVGLEADERWVIDTR